MRARAAAALLIMLSAGAAGPAAGAEPGAPVRVFESGELPPHAYRVVERLWTGTWRASFFVPRHADAGAAIAALTSAAARLGADGVMDLYCVEDAGGWRAGYTCYGLAIRLKQAPNRG